MKHVVVVLPTYNEKENIGRLIKAIFAQATNLHDLKLSVLVVDDSSPDRTQDVVTALMKDYQNLHLLSGKKEGLGVACMRGFHYAMRQLQADIVVEMDADFSHNPSDLPLLLGRIQEGADFVIGSRYIPGGSIPKNWPFYRKLNSKLGNIFAKHIAGLNPVNDCTSGYRAMRASILKKIHVSKIDVKGYAFLLKLLFSAKKNNAIIIEVPIHFIDRHSGKSKMGMGDIIEFVEECLMLRFPRAATFLYYTSLVLLGVSLALGSTAVIAAGIITFHMILAAFILLLSVFLIAQGSITIFSMIYAWEDPERVNKTKSPRTFEKAHYSFTAIVPARQEGTVIADTIEAIDAIDYPDHLKEIIVVCKKDDTDTILAVKETILDLENPQIKLVTFNDDPINKPHALNVGLEKATKQVIVVFDAEDEPHKDIYKVANTVMLREKADVVQSGIQLMNYRSSWFSTLNVLEYFFWFKSSLQFFARTGFILLAGNTVFVKKEWIKRVNGWDENCLTEDADMGIRLSISGARIQVVYDEKHTTKEETPPTMASFIKQRTRWNQGFLQVLMKGDWRHLPKFSQRILAVYSLVWPEVQAILFILAPLSVLTILLVKLPVGIAMLSAIPFYILLLQFVTYAVGAYEFTKDYKLTYPIWIPVKILLTFFPFQILLSMSAIRAFIRHLMNKTAWEKTQHTNAHRVDTKFDIPYLSQPSYV